MRIRVAEALGDPLRLLKEAEDPLLHDMGYLCQQRAVLNEHHLNWSRQCDDNYVMYFKI